MAFVEVGTNAPVNVRICAKSAIVMHNIQIAGIENVRQYLGHINWRVRCRIGSLQRYIVQGARLQVGPHA